LFQAYSDRSSYPWEPYGRFYDWTAVDRYYRQREFAKALHLLRALVRGERTASQLAMTYQWIGWCCVELKRYETAERAFSQAIGYEPDKPLSFNYRGWIREITQQHEKARTDYEQALRLDAGNVYARSACKRLEMVRTTPAPPPDRAAKTTPAPAPDRDKTSPLDELLRGAVEN
jgi:tetratricopeptide (TPR) repeat protein